VLLGSGNGAVQAAIQLLGIRHGTVRTLRLARGLNRDGTASLHSENRSGFQGIRFGAFKHNVYSSGCDRLWVTGPDGPRYQRPDASGDVV